MRSGRASIGLVLFGVALLSGCQGLGNRFELPRVLGGSSSEVKQASYAEGGEPAQASPAMTAADNMFREERYEKAESLYADIADDTKQRPEVAERARFFHA